MSYEAIAQALDAYTDHTRFEALTTQLLARLGIDLRPTGGSGDKGRDAVAGLYEAEGGEPLAVTISLERTWAAKIARDIDRITASGFRPNDVISVTNRPTSEATRSKLQTEQAPTIRST
jgi:HJR/Mrr/RecB family endonuclease